MEDRSKTVLVTGAAGFVGSYVVREFLEEGYEVRAFIRETSGLAQLSRVLGVTEEGLAGIKNLSFAKGDITNIDSLDAAMEGVEKVIDLFE